MDCSFESSLRSTKQVTIFWCPVVKASNKSDRDTPTKFGQKRIFNRKWARDQRIAPVSLPTGNKNGTLADAAGQLSPPTIRERISQDTKDFANRMRSTGMLGSWDFINRSDGKVPPSGDKVMMADLCLKSDPLSAMHRWDRFFRIDSPGEFNLSLGFYETDCPDSIDMPWFPEVNVSGTYDGERLRHIQGKAGLDLAGYLRHYCRRMLQNSVYLLLHDENGRVDAWLYDYDSLHGTGQMAHLSGTHEWHLQMSQPKHWQWQFFYFWRNLYDTCNPIVGRGKARTKGRAKVRGEMEEMAKLAGTNRPFVGATIAPLLGDDSEVVARLIVSGRARFLFETAFQSELPPINETSRDDADLILLHTDQADDGLRSVHYAVYAPDPGAAVRCLCGWHYPGHAGHRCKDQNALSVVRHREYLTHWIAFAIENHRGVGWDWRLLSSPHFYFADDADSLKRSATSSRRRAAEAAAKNAAKDEWESLLRSILCGNE